jgi:hypothetical protein
MARPASVGAAEALVRIVKKAAAAEEARNAIVAATAVVRVRPRVFAPATAASQARSEAGLVAPAAVLLVGVRVNAAGAAEGPLLVGAAAGTVAARLAGGAYVVARAAVLVTARVDASEATAQAPGFRTRRVTGVG